MILIAGVVERCNFSDLFLIFYRQIFGRLIVIFYAAVEVNLFIIGGIQTSSQLI